MDIKEQKLAAARKKLRQYRKKKGSSRIASSSSSRENTPNCEGESYEKNEESLSRTSSINEFNDTPVKSEDDSPSLLEINGITSQAPLQGHEASPIEEDSTLLSGRELFPRELPEAKVFYDFPSPVYNNSTSHNGPSENFVHEGSVSSDTNVTTTTAIRMDGNGPESTPLRSTSETLRQLSFQMSGLVQDSEHRGADFEPESLTVELEKRNNELAVLLEQERQKSFQQFQLNEELKERIHTHESQIALLQNATTTTSFNIVEANGLREQLQVHIQTIGILVAEKSELQSSLAHSRHALEQRTGETTELQGRLDASRHRVRELETSVHDLETQSSSLSKSLETTNHQLSNLQTNHSKNSKLHEELKVSSAEHKERLALKTEENQRLTSDLATMKKELELAQVHIQQLRDNTLEEMRSQLDQLQVVYNESQNRIQFLNNSLENSQRERAQMEQEYKSYASQIASEVESLKQKLIKEEKKLEELQNINLRLEEKLKVAQTQILPTPSPEDTKEKDDLKASNGVLEAERASLLAKTESLERDNGQLSHMVSVQRRKMDEIEIEVERRNSEEVDTTQLLQSMQSDKIAAARALSQNKQLKHQLEELQNGFIMMSNKKLELTEKLESEFYMKKGLNQELSSLGEEISSLKESLLLKKRENESLREALTSRLKERPERNSPQNEISDSSAEIAEEALETENEMTRMNSKDPDSVASPAKREVGSLQNESSNASDEGRTRTDPLEETNNHDGITFSHEGARLALEKKFTQCMGELATVSDERQRLDHLVQQLQIETDTVGDYITIYQFQRGVMKKRTEELTSELDSLRLEKDQMRKKLLTLQDLVSQLVLEKVPSEEKLISGLYSFINSNETSKGIDTVSQTTTNGELVPTHEGPYHESSNPGLVNGMESTPVPSTHNQPVRSSELPNEKSKDTSSKSATVQQIMDLISEMEATSQIDHSHHHELHHCPLCSGKLITI